MLTHQLSLGNQFLLVNEPSNFWQCAAPGRPAALFRKVVFPTPVGPLTSTGVPVPVGSRSRSRPVPDSNPSALQAPMQSRSSRIASSRRRSLGRLLRCCLLRPEPARRGL